MLKDMEYVYTVYLEKSFSKAAEKLFISQPALSATIKKLESKIKVPIFDRSTNPIQLTPAGKYYIKSIEKIMEIQNDMIEYFNSLAEEKQVSITIGSAAFFCAHILPLIKLIASLTHRYLLSNPLFTR
ncbi:LysR family transcriptional regulator [Clostridiaceae bacterium 35-E11]